METSAPAPRRKPASSSAMRAPAPQPATGLIIAPNLTGRPVMLAGCRGRASERVRQESPAPAPVGRPADGPASSGAPCSGFIAEPRPSALSHAAETMGWHTAATLRQSKRCRDGISSQGPRGRSSCDATNSTRHRHSGEVLLKCLRVRTARCTPGEPGTVDECRRAPCSSLTAAPAATRPRSGRHGRRRRWWRVSRGIRR